MPIIRPTPISVFSRRRGDFQIFAYARPSCGVVCEHYDPGAFEIDADELEPRPRIGETSLFR